MVINTEHATTDSGTFYKNSQEKVDTLKLIMDVRKELTKNGIGVIYNRTTDFF
ncbi:MAG: hypothetical protein HUJ74_02615 [Lachnospiraceae bacterium]|nr:hypothetical protein [Lachnospiraceae bacterium]